MARSESVVAISEVNRKASRVSFIDWLGLGSRIYRQKEVSQDPQQPIARFSVHGVKPEGYTIAVRYTVQVEMLQLRYERSKNGL